MKEWIEKICNEEVFVYVMGYLLCKTSFNYKLKPSYLIETQLIVWLSSLAFELVFK